MFIYRPNVAFDVLAYVAYIVVVFKNWSYEIERKLPTNGFLLNGPKNFVLRATFFHNRPSKFFVAIENLLFYKIIFNFL